MPDLKHRILEDIKTAMRAKSDTLKTLRLLSAAIKQKEVDERIDSLGDEQIISTINSMLKQRKDSIVLYLEGKRQDLADIEQTEIEIISEYLPEQLGEEEIKQAVLEAIGALEEKSPKAMGQVMGSLKQALQGKADMGLVSKLVKEALMP